jgi:hypothetical protein
LTNKNSYIEQLHGLCEIPPEYRHKDIKPDLKWDIFYAVNSDKYFSCETENDLESHTILFPNQIEDSPYFIKHPWIFLQHEYAHALLAERLNGFGLYEFEGSPNPKSSNKTLLVYLDPCMNSVVDWFTDGIVANRFSVPFREASRASHNYCIGTFGGTLDNFVYDLYYAYSLAQADFYAFNLHAILPNKSQITNHLKKVFLNQNPNKPSNDAIAEAVNGILSILIRNKIIGSPVILTVVNKKLFRDGKSKNMSVLDFKIGNSPRSG